jgi:hypothetical protein
MSAASCSRVTFFIIPPVEVVLAKAARKNRERSDRVLPISKSGG